MEILGDSEWWYCTYQNLSCDPQYSLKTGFEQWLFCQTCFTVAAHDRDLAASFMDPEPNLASAMQALEVSRSFERLKNALLRGHSQCDS